MLWLDERNAVDYLKSQGWVQPHEKAEAAVLSGGVSNQVLYISLTDRPDSSFVVKQARPQLRVPDPWFSRIDRIWREVDFLQACRELLADSAAGDVQTPEVLFEDRDAYLFGMTAAPRSHCVWKTLLLQGEFDSEVAVRCGRLMGRLHAGSWRSPTYRERFSDRAVFDELRIDPYYRRTAEVFPHLKPAFDDLAASLDAHCEALVHADFSPKNLLVYPGGLMLVDFETGHFGDPAFDLGFFLTHLYLKTAYHRLQPQGPADLTQAFWSAYQSQCEQTAAGDFPALAVRAARNLGGCLLARLDGKSRIDYLTDEPIRGVVRAFAAQLLRDGADSPVAPLDRFVAELEAEANTRSQPPPNPSA